MIDGLVGLLFLNPNIAGGPGFLGPLGYTAIIALAGILEASLAYVSARKLRKITAYPVIFLLLTGNVGFAVWCHSREATMYQRVGDLVSIFLCLATALGWFTGSISRSRLITIFICATGTLVASIALAASSDILGDFAWKRANEVREQNRLETATVKALRCIAELRKRDPVADADSDYSRGDATPVGVTTEAPGETITPTTDYEAACDDNFAGYYRPTGKWFVDKSRYWRLSQPKEQYTCNRAQRDYITRYNQQMLKRAPVMVRKFCRSQRLLDDTRLYLATEAVFSTAHRKYKWSREGVPDIIDGAAYFTKAAWLIDAKSGPVLVTKSRLRQSAGECPRFEDCADLAGLAYLTEEDQHFSLKRRWPTVMKVGDRASRGIGLSWGNLLTRSGEVSLRESYTTGDCFHGRETLIELAPAGPVNRGTIYDNVSSMKGGRGWSQVKGGQIENIVVGKSFDVVERGTGIVEHYEMKSGRFVGPQKSQFMC